MYGWDKKMLGSLFMMLKYYLKQLYVIMTS